MAITVVQSQAGSSAIQSTVTMTLAAPTTVGNCLVVCAVLVDALGSHAVGAVSGITLGGSAGNFAVAETAKQGASTADAEIWTDFSCAGGQTSVVVTEAGASLSGYNMYADAYEVSGLAGTVDQVQSATGATLASWSSGSTATTTSAAEIWFGVLGAQTGGSPAAGLPGAFTNATLGSGNGQAFSGYQIVSAKAAAAYGGTWTGGTSGKWAACIVTLAGIAPLPPSGLFLRQAVQTAATR